MKSTFNIAVYCGATMPMRQEYCQAARELGAEIARRGMGLVFGGSREGTMQLVSQAALDAGGEVLGVFPDSLPESWLMPGLTEVIRVHTLAERKHQMLLHANAVIALPGSFGTWDELFDALALRKIGGGVIAHPCGVLNICGFYDGLLEFIAHSCAEGFTDQASSNLLLSAKSAGELIDMLVAAAG